MTLQEMADEIVQLKATYPIGDSYANSRVMIMKYELMTKNKTFADVFKLIGKENK